MHQEMLLLQLPTNQWTIIIIFDLNIDNFVFFEKKSWILALHAYFDHVLCIDISIFYFLFLKLYFG